MKKKTSRRGKAFLGICKTAIKHNNEPEALPNGTIIYWNEISSEIYCETHHRYFVQVQCPACHQKRRVRVGSVSQYRRKGIFTGLCSSCNGKLVVPIPRVGKDHHAWQGGVFLHSEGYHMVTLEPNHPYIKMAPNSYSVYEHRLVMAEKLGRPLRGEETVHHLNGNKLNNNSENLQLLQSRSEHAKLHAKQRARAVSPNSTP